MKAPEFMARLRRDEITSAIGAAEQLTSGEIRVVVCGGRVDDAVAAAQQAFDKLGMSRTRERNGVLIFIAPLDRAYAVIGDTAIHARCGEAFWSRLAEELGGHFRNEQFHEGLLHAVRRAGELLAEHFPRRPDDRNELSDDVVVQGGGG